MLYIIRHGQTDGNVRHRLQGKTDIPLNENGRRMAGAAREQYRDIPFDICFSSPLLRAYETAQIVLEGRNVPIIKDERLSEMGFGDHEGMEYGPSAPDSPVNVLFDHPEAYAAPGEGAESFAALFARTGAFLEEVALPLHRQGKAVLIAGHIAMNSSIICRLRNIPLARFWSAGTDNCRLERLL